MRWPGRSWTRLITSITLWARDSWSPSIRRVLTGELQKRGLRAAAQQPVPVVYEGTRFEMGFRADLLVEDKVIVEIKSVENIAAVHKKQLLSYLRLSDK
jgi:GxxExxY protein